MRKNNIKHIYNIIIKTTLKVSCNEYYRSLVAALVGCCRHESLI